VKFLVDRCAGRRLADWLRSEGHDVVETRQRGHDPGDLVVLKWAAAEGRVLITIDTDFGALIFKEGEAHCGVVRLPDVPPAQRIGITDDLLARHTPDLERGAIVTVRGGRIRVSQTA